MPGPICIRPLGFDIQANGSWCVVRKNSEKKFVDAIFSLSDITDPQPLYGCRFFYKDEAEKLLWYVRKFHPDLDTSVRFLNRCGYVYSPEQSEDYVITIIDNELRFGKYNAQYCFGHGNFTANHIELPSDIQQWLSTNSPGLTVDCYLDVRHFHFRKPEHAIQFKLTWVD